MFAATLNEKRQKFPENGPIGRGLSREIRRLCLGQFAQKIGCDFEDMAGRACGGPDGAELQKARVEIAVRWREVADRGDPANGKSRHGAHGFPVGATQWLARQCGGLFHIHLIAARRDEEVDRAACLALENDRLGDLVKLASRLFGSLRGGAGLAIHFEDMHLCPCGFECGFDTFEAFGHLRRVLSVASG